MLIITDRDYLDIFIKNTPCPRCGESTHLSTSQYLEDIFEKKYTKGIEPPFGYYGFFGRQYGSILKNIKNHGVKREHYWEVYACECRTCGLSFDTPPLPVKDRLTKDEMIEYIKYTYPNISLDDYSAILVDYTY